MTLDTRIAIQGKAPYSAMDIFRQCRTLLDTPDTVPVDQKDSRWNEGTKMLMHPPGVGLEAWLIMYYGADGPLVHQHDKWCDTELGGEYNTTQEQIDAHAEDIASDPAENGWATMVVSIDTSYGFRNDRGESCSQRHARFIFELGTWLEACGMEWKWRNEYTDEWHSRYEGLKEFGGYHNSPGGPNDWFRNTVLPAIERMAKEGA